LSGNLVEEMPHPVSGLRWRVDAGQQREILDVATKRSFVANGHGDACVLPPKIRLL